MFKFFNNNNFSFNYNLGSKTWFGTGGKCFCFITVDSKRMISIMASNILKKLSIIMISMALNVKNHIPIIARAG